MKPSDYKFEVGDKVVTVYGEVGRVTEICTCESCKRRGFDELTWVEDCDDAIGRYVTKYDAEYGFSSFRQIGKYKFNNVFEKDVVLRDIALYEELIERCEQQLKVIGELEAEEKQLKTSCSNCTHQCLLAGYGYKACYICRHPNHLGDLVQPYTVCDDYKAKERDVND